MRIRPPLLLCTLALLACTGAFAGTAHVQPTVQTSSQRRARGAPQRRDTNGSDVGGGGERGAAGPAAPWRRADNAANIAAENAWKNGLVLWVLPDAWRERMPLLVQSWARNWVLSTALYLVVGAAWAYYAYYCFGDQLYPPGHIPSILDMAEQVKVAMMAMPIYAVLPAVTEYAAERGWTMSYARVAEVGLPRYVAYFVVYMASVEFFVYWQHRLLHDVRLGYRLLHHIHHKYNKEHTLSPFAGLAFHPIDGILQALPYSWMIFLVPMHFLTHELLLFATAVWTTNIHDCLHGKVAPIMGAGFHTIHHTTYKHNYGHYTTYMDGLFGTLITPEEYERQQAAGGKSD